jgi:hypothetical protein
MSPKTGPRIRRPYTRRLTHFLDPPPAGPMLLRFYLLEEYVRLRMGLARNGVKGIDRLRN